MVLNALDAAERGAVILTRTRCIGARRVDGRWQAELLCRETGARRTVHARALVNAAGPWVEQMLERIPGIQSRRRIRLVKGSHIVTQKFWDGPQAYLLQNTDRRVIFVNPYEGDLALIGTTDIAVEGEPDDGRDRARRDRLSAGGGQPLLRARSEPRRRAAQLFRRPAAL